MPGLNLGTFGGTSARPQATTAPQPVASVTAAAFGPGYAVAPQSTGAALAPNDPFGISFWIGAGAIGGLAYLRHTLPGNMKRQFDLVIIMLILFAPAKGLAKSVAARHASQDTGIPKAVAGAANIIL